MIFSPRRRGIQDVGQEVLGEPGRGKVEPSDLERERPVFDGATGARQHEQLLRRKRHDSPPR